MNSRCYKLYRAYSISFNSSNIAIFLWSWILKYCKVVVLCSRSPQNVKLGIFTSKSCSDGKEMYKKAWCTCKVVVLLSCCSRCRRRRRCLSSWGPFSRCWVTPVSIGMKHLKGCPHLVLGQGTSAWILAQNGVVFTPWASTRYETVCIVTPFRPVRRHFITWASQGVQRRAGLPWN